MKLKKLTIYCLALFCSSSSVYAQSGEDAIISYILKFLQIQSNEITYLDLGANHAKELSNTFYFLQKWWARRISRGES